jgi:hypothetical protein
MQIENCKLEIAEARPRDFAAEIYESIDLLTGHYNRGNWRGVARLASGIARTAKAAEREQQWSNDTRVGLTEKAAALSEQELEEAIER